MSNIFVKDLWEKNPELLIKGLSFVTGIDKQFLVIDERVYGKHTFADGHIIFCVKKILEQGYSNTIKVSDFDISYSMSLTSEEIKHKWVKFMYNTYGCKYALQYISNRNKQLDKFMAEYEEKYNNETKTVLDEIGFNSSKGQTK